MKKELVKHNTLPDAFNTDSYAVFQGKPSRLLDDGDIIDLGERKIRILHTPGHSPGHICLWEEERGYLFTGDLVYKGTLYENYLSTSPEDYLISLDKILKLSANRIFPAHHNIDIKPNLISEMSTELRKLKDKKLLKHGSGCFVFNEWKIQL